MDGPRSWVKRVTAERARLRIRGSSSSGLDKKAYDMELWDPDDDEDRNEPLLGLPSNADWVLCAPFYWDDALVQNPLATSTAGTLDRRAADPLRRGLPHGRDRPLRAGDYQGSTSSPRRSSRTRTGSTSSDSIRMTSTPSGSPGATSSSAIERRGRLRDPVR